MARDFYLVQRITRSWHADNDVSATASPLAKVRNLFGNGTLGDYDLEYMGASEFEWGAIPEALGRLKDAGKNGLVLTEWNYGGYVFDFLYRKKDGEPFEAWANWAEGRVFDDYTGKEYSERPFYGCETPYELRERVEGADKPKFGDEWRTHVWWALDANVMWGFHDDGHLPRMLESMGRTTKAAA